MADTKKIKIKNTDLDNEIAILQAAWTANDSDAQVSTTNKYLISVSIDKLTKMKEVKLTLNDDNTEVEIYKVVGGK